MPSTDDQQRQERRFRRREEEKRDKRVEQDIMEIAHKLTKMADGSKTADCAPELVTALEDMRVNSDLLKKTRIGTVLNDFRKSVTDETIAKRCKTLIKRWNVLLGDQRHIRRSTSRSPERHRRRTSDDWERTHSSTSADHKSRRSEPKKEVPSFVPSGKLKREPKEEAKEDGDGRNDKSNDNKEEPDKEKPSFVPSGKLAKDTNTYKGVLIKYNEPPEAKLPKLRWRMYPFKGDDHLPVIYVHRQSAYLIGRDRKISDFPIDHPSCSKQHAVLQYRSLPFERLDGSRGRRTRPYIIDLGSGNGTFLNGDRIEAQRYYELKEKDVLRFGFSSREYVMLHEQSLQDNGETDTSEEEDEVGDVIDRTGGDERMADEDDIF